MAKLNIEKQKNHAFTTKKASVGSWGKLYETFSHTSLQRCPTVFLCGEHNYGK